MLEAHDLAAVERDVSRIPGPSSGLSWRYFLMLAGREDLVKPDRIIFRFLERIVGRQVDPDEAQAMLTAAAQPNRTGGILALTFARLAALSATDAVRSFSSPLGSFSN